MSQIDPFNIPFETVQEKNGVKIQTWGNGTPLVVIPGLEGSGESCLHFIVPAVEAGRTSGVSLQLCLVNYAQEQHKDIDSLGRTIEELLLANYQKEAVLIYSQSFGNLLMARLGSGDNLAIKRVFMISPFTKLPGLMSKISYYSLFVTPTWVYRNTIKPMARYVFGPVGNSNKKHPFFDALTRATSSGVRRQTRWLLKLDYEEVFPKIKAPAIISLGVKDRLVNIKEQIAYYEAACSTRNDWKLVLNQNNGHVIFMPEEIDWAKDEIVKFLQ